MYQKNAVRFFAVALFATLMAVPMWAQVADANTITCVSSSGCVINHVPLFASTGGPATVKDSIMTQGGGRVHVAGGVSVANHATVGNNTVYGSNGQTDSLATGAGVFGQLSTTGQSSTGAAWGNGGGGTWGDGGQNDSSTTLANYAVIGTTDNKAAGIFQANSPNYYALFGYNFATGGTGFMFAVDNADGKGCNIDPLGDLTCSGSKNAVVPVDNGKHWVALSAVESPKNWFEDFGSQQLMGGVATVRLDPRFAQTVNTGVEYHVFLTPNGDCKGLYVNQKTPTSFEVRELGGGNSSVKFDYRITALRKSYEKVRFAEHREFPLSKDGRVYPAQ